MKRIFLLPLLALLISCGGEMSKYEKVIADAVQTDSRGTKLDLNFKIDKIEEVGRISVADSIVIITEAFNADREKRIDGLNETVRRNIENLDREKNSRIPSRTMMDFLQSNIDRTNNVIDSLRATSPMETARYENRNQNEVLAVVVRCTYTIDEPLTKVRATETFDFFISPDATKCYSKKRVR